MVERLTPAGYRVIATSCLDECLCLAMIDPFDLDQFGQSFPESSTGPIRSEIVQVD